MAVPATKVEELRELVEKQDKWHYMTKTWDYVFWLTAAPVVGAAAFITKILFAGDWEFWTDWKDRQWWMVVMAMANAIIPSALQYIQWAAWRFPTGFTYTGVSMWIADWLGLWAFWSNPGWAGYPLNFVWRATIVPAGILVDWILFKTRSFLLTTIVGMLVWTFALWWSNLATLAPYLQPAVWMDRILTLADVQGIEYLRTQTPEYLRIIETSAVRTFLGEQVWVTLFFAYTTSMVGYWIGQFIGRYLAVWPIGRFLKKW